MFALLRQENAIICAKIWCVTKTKLRIQTRSEKKTCQLKVNYGNKKREQTEMILCTIL